MSDKQECRGCIGFDDEHTCTGYSDFQAFKEARESITKASCCACLFKDARIAELEANRLCRCADEVRCDLKAEIARLRGALRQVWDCEEYESCPTCKLIAREALEDSDGR